MAEYTLICKVQPLPGEPCPADQSAWVSTFDAQYSHWRDLLFGAPPINSDILLIIQTTTAIAILLGLPIFVSRLIENVRDEGLR